MCLANNILKSLESKDQKSSAIVIFVLSIKYDLLQIKKHQQDRNTYSS